jgi:protein-tyrosine kinase
MIGRTDLIERAAARLRQDVTPEPEPIVPEPVVPPPLAKMAPKMRATSGAPVQPLKQHLTLDRTYLAQRGILMPWTTTARVVEEFRIIKRNLMAEWQPAEKPETAEALPRVVMVTSARPREGKTFSSINLALAFAAEEKFTTVLIDADTVRADTARMLQLPTELGFTDVLAGKLSLSDALVQSDLENLVVLPPGAPGPHVPELLTSEAPARLISTIAERYPNHVIVMDTPPCLASTDPTALAAVARQVVFVVEATHTQQSEIESALSLISSCSHISFLLNLVPHGAGDHFGSYSYYQAPKR